MFYVMFGVFCASHNNQIVEGIVLFVAINMVHRFLRQQFPRKMSLHDQAMFGYIGTPSLSLDVDVGVVIKPVSYRGRTS